MSAVGLASHVTRIAEGAVNEYVATGSPIIVNELVLTGANTVPFGGQYIFQNADDLSTLFTVTIRPSSTLTIDVHFVADHGLAVTTPTGGSVTITHSHPGR